MEHANSIPGFYQPVSALSHLLAAGAAVIAGVSLIRLGRGSRERGISLAIYVCSVVALLAISGTYHSLDAGGRARAVMQRLDYLAIWLLIGGTFTAVHGVMGSGFWRRRALALVWIYAAVGILLQAFWFSFFSGVPGLILYLGMGWAGLGSAIKLGRTIGFRFLRPLWYGGVILSAGAIAEACGQPVLIRNWVGPHEFLHLTVIAGIALHGWFIRRLLLLVRASPIVETTPSVQSGPGQGSTPGGKQPQPPSCVGLQT